MDDLERRNLVQAMKAKAKQASAEKQRREQDLAKLMHIRFNGAKRMAANEHALKVLESPHARQLTQIDNRPAEKLAKGRTRGMKKGPQGPGL